MRRQVLSGAALDELTPLSVDTHRLNTEARYTPAQVESFTIFSALFTFYMLVLACYAAFIPTCCVMCYIQKMNGCLEDEVPLE